MGSSSDGGGVDDFGKSGGWRRRAMTVGQHGSRGFPDPPRFAWNDRTGCNRKQGSLVSENDDRRDALQRSLLSKNRRSEHGFGRRPKNDCNKTLELSRVQIEQLRGKRARRVPSQKIHSGAKQTGRVRFAFERREHVPRAERGVVSAQKKRVGVGVRHLQAPRGKERRWREGAVLIFQLLDGRGEPSSRGIHCRRERR